MKPLSPFFLLPRVQHLFPLGGFPFGYPAGGVSCCVSDFGIWEEKQLLASDESYSLVSTFM